jgi:hypothetical protein
MTSGSFQKIKSDFKGQSFQDFKGIKKPTALKAIPQQELQKCLQL